MSSAELMENARQPDQQPGDKTLNATNEGDENESDLGDLELSLRALERLDRSSPDLWPEQIPGVNQFLPSTPSITQESPNQPGEWLQGLTREDTELLLQLGTLPVHDILNEVRQLQNMAYQLGQEETKEMTRGKYLNVLRRRSNT